MGPSSCRGKVWKGKLRECTTFESLRMALMITLQVVTSSITAVISLQQVESVDCLQQYSLCEARYCLIFDGEFVQTSLNPP